MKSFKLSKKNITLKQKITFTLECPKFNSSRQILGNPSTIKQVLGEENFKNIFNFFTSIGLAKLL